MANVEIKVGARITLDVSGVIAPVVTELCEEFTHANPQHAKLKAMGFFAANEPRVITTWTARDNVLTLPRGGMARLRAVLKKHGIAFAVKDQRVGSARRPVSMKGSVPPHLVKLYDYQADAMNAALQTENCIVRAPTGSGKTTIALAFASACQTTVLVSVHSGGLFDQWIERAQRELGMQRHEIGIIRGATKKLKPLTIAMQQTLNAMTPAHWKQVQDSFGAVIADEVHHASATTFFKTFDRIPARYRIGISADESRRDRKEFLTHDLFGDVAFEVTQSELVDRAIVHDVQVKLVPTVTEAEWYVEARADGGMPDWSLLLATLTGDTARTDAAVRLIAESAREGFRCLVFSGRVEHCREVDARLRALGVRSGLMLGGDEWKDTYRETRAKLESGEVTVAIGTPQAVGEGIDLPAVDRGFLLTPMMSRQAFGQVRGRICRTATGKSDAAIFVMWDRRVFGKSIAENMAKWNKNVVVVEDDGSETEINKYLERSER